MTLDLINPLDMSPDIAKELASEAVNYNKDAITNLTNTIITPLIDEVLANESSYASIYKPIIKGGTKLVRDNELKLSEMQKDLLSYCISQVLCNQGRLTNITNNLRKDESNEVPISSPPTVVPILQQDSRQTTTKLQRTGFRGRAAFNAGLNTMSYLSKGTRKSVARDGRTSTTFERTQTTDEIENRSFVPPSEYIHSPPESRIEPGEQEGSSTNGEAAILPSRQEVAINLGIETVSSLSPRGCVDDLSRWRYAITLSTTGLYEYHLLAPCMGIGKDVPVVHCRYVPEIDPTVVDPNTYCKPKPTPEPEPFPEPEPEPFPEPEPEKETCPEINDTVQLHVSMDCLQLPEALQRRLEKCGFKKCIKKASIVKEKPPRTNPEWMKLVNAILIAIGYLK